MERAKVILCCLLAICIAGFNILNPYAKSQETLWLASLLLVVGFWPMLRWLGDRGRDAIPVLPMHGVFCAISYGMAGLLDDGQMFGLFWTSESQRQDALLTVLLGLTGLYIGYYVGGAPLSHGRTKLHWPFRVRYPAYEWLVFVIYPLFLAADVLIGIAKIDVVGQVLTGLYTFLFVLLVHALFSGRLPGNARKGFLYLILPCQFILGSGLGSGLLAGLFALAMSVGITYVSVRRKIPYTTILLASAAVLFLNPVKHEFRALTWNSQPSEMSPIAKVELFLDMGWAYYFSDQASSLTQLESGSTTTYDRINHLMVLAAVVADTPEKQPFLYGDTYAPLLTKWIPRILWPGKPLEDLGNAWAQRYGYLQYDDYTTAFNLPWLPEMYMNFGIFGVVGVYLLLGILMRYFAINFWRAPPDSSAFAFGMMLGVPLLIGDTNLSLVLGSTIINALALVLSCKIAAKSLPRLFSWDAKSR